MNRHCCVDLVVELDVGRRSSSTLLARGSRDRHGGGHREDLSRDKESNETEEDGTGRGELRSNEAHRGQRTHHGGQGANSAIHQQTHDGKEEDQVNSGHTGCKEHHTKTEGTETQHDTVDRGQTTGQGQQGEEERAQWSL